MILRFCLLFIAIQASKIPKIKWGQDENWLYLTIFAQCTDTDKKLEITMDTFLLECGSNVVHMTLRDDIEPAGSKCKAALSGDAQVCHLKKKNTIRFDRLVADAAEWRKFGTRISVDYDRMKFNEDAEEPFIVYKKGVVRVTDENFSIMSKKETLILDVYYSGCGSCAYVREAFSRSSHNLRKKFPDTGVVFGFVDALENPILRRKFNASCTYECPFTIVKSEVNIPVIVRETSQMDKIFTQFIKPLFTELNSVDSLNKFISSNEYSLIGFFPPEDHLIDAEMALSVAASGARYGIVHDTSVIEASNVTSTPSVFFFKNESQSKIPYLGPMEPVALSQFVGREKLELIENYDNYMIRNKRKELGISTVILYLGLGTHEDVRATHSASVILDQAEVVARQFREQLGFELWTDIDDMHFLNWMGVSKDDFPMLAIVQNFDHGTPRYKYEGPTSTIGSSEMIKFCQDYLDGNLPETFQSEIPPSGPFESGIIRQIVWRTWQAEVLDNLESDVLLMMANTRYGSDYTKWNKTMGIIAGYLKEIPNIMIGTYLKSENYLSTDLYDESVELPEIWIWLFPSGRLAGSKPLRYSGKRSQKSILIWLKKNAPRIKAAWHSVKSATKKAKQAIEEQKRLEEEKKKAFEEELENLEKIDISGDGGIIKQIKKEGKGDTKPTKGAKVLAQYTGTLEDGTVFDTSTTRSAPFEFSLGQGQVIQCWDQGFATMKKLESAILTCKPDYAYGENGSPPKIPGGATLRFEVELLNWTGGETETNSEGNKDEL